MIETASPATITLALLTGFVCLASGMVALLLPADGVEAVDELEQAPVLAVSAAFGAILFGAFLILAQRSWSDPLAVIVSLIGWTVFLEGLLLLGLPRLYVRIARPLMRHARYLGLFALMLGAFLIVASLTARATPIN